MQRYTRMMAAGALLGLGLWVAGQASGRTDEKETKEAILKLIETMKKDPNGAKKQAEELGKKVDLGEVMNLFKPRAKGGIGFDPKADAKSDGIEKKYQDLAKARPAVTKQQLQDQAADYARMIEITQTIAEVAQHVTPPKAQTAGKGPKDWKQYIEEMKKGSKELSEAVKAADPMKVKTAASNLNSACNNCHTDFR
jgi:hypothetical protein